MLAYYQSIGRVRLVAKLPDQPSGGLEVKDALHVASFCALCGATWQLHEAWAQAQRDLPFLRQRHDLAEDELLCAAALSGDWDTVMVGGERFTANWAAAGRPAAPGRGMSPAAVALAFGVQGNDQARRVWLGVLAEIRGVPPEDAGWGTGYGEVFEAMVLLHHYAAAVAFEVLTEACDRGLYGLVLSQWTAALAAEAAVLAQRPDAATWVARAQKSSAGHPVACAITRLAAARMAGDVDLEALAALVAEFAAAGAGYHAARTEKYERERSQ